MKKLIALFLCLISLLPCYALDIKSSEFPDFKQYDEQWANYMYSSYNNEAQTIENFGCSLCAMCDIIVYWFDSTVTPIDLAKLSIHKYKSCAYEGGTTSYFNYAIATDYNFSRVIYTQYLDRVVDCLNSGGLVIATYYIKSARALHDVCVYKVNASGTFFFAHNPSSSKNFYQISRNWLERYGVEYFCYWPPNDAMKDK